MREREKWQAIDTEAEILKKITELSQIARLYEGAEKQLNNYVHITQIELTENQLKELSNEMDESIWIKFAENINQSIESLNRMSGEMKNLFENIKMENRQGGGIEKINLNEQLLKMDKIKTGLINHKDKLERIAADLKSQKNNQFPRSSKIKEVKRKLGKGTKKIFASVHQHNLNEYHENLKSVSAEFEFFSKKTTVISTPELELMMKKMSEAVTADGVDEAANNIKNWKKNKDNADRFAELARLSEIKGQIQERWKSTSAAYQTELKALQSLVILQIEDEISKLTKKNNDGYKEKINTYRELLEKIKKNDIVNFEKFSHEKSGIKKIKGLASWREHVEQYQFLENKMKQDTSSEGMQILTSNVTNIDQFSEKFKAAINEKKNYVSNEVIKANADEISHVIDSIVLDISKNLISGLSLNQEFQLLLDQINPIKENIETREKMMSVISNFSNHPDMQKDEDQLKNLTAMLHSLVQDNDHDQEVILDINNRIDQIYQIVIGDVTATINTKIAKGHFDKEQLTNLIAVPGMNIYLDSHPDQKKALNDAHVKLDREIQINQLITNAKKNTDMPNQADPRLMMEFLNNIENKTYLSGLKEHDNDRFSQFYDLFYQESMNDINKNLDRLIIGNSELTLSNMEILLNEHHLIDEARNADVEKTRGKINALNAIKEQYDQLKSSASISAMDDYIAKNKQFLAANHLMSDLIGVRTELERKKISDCTADSLRAMLDRIEKEMKEKNDPCHLSLQMILSSDHVQDILRQNKNIEERVIRLNNQSSESMANTLTAHNKAIVENFDAYELLRDPVKEPIPTITAFVEFFNKTNAFVISDILSRKSIDERTLAIEYWISVAEKSLTNPAMKDVNLAFAISAALNDASIDRLKSSYEGISPHANEIMRVLAHLTDLESSAKNAREYMQDHPDCIPYLGHFISDFTNLREGGNSDLVDLVGIQGFELAYHQFAKIASNQQQSRLIEMDYAESKEVIEAIQQQNIEKNVKFNEYKISKDLESSDPEKRPKKSNILSNYKGLYRSDTRPVPADQTSIPMQRTNNQLVVLNKDNFNFMPILRHAGYQVGIITDGIDDDKIPSDIHFKISSQSQKNEIDKKMEEMERYYSDHLFELYSIVTYEIVLPPLAITPKIHEQIGKMAKDKTIFNKFFEQIKPKIVNDVMISQMAKEANIDKNNTMLMHEYAHDFLLNKRRHILNQNDLVHDSAINKGMAIVYLLKNQPQLFDRDAKDEKLKLKNSNHIEIIKRYFNELSDEDLTQFSKLLSQPIDRDVKIIDVILGNDQLNNELKDQLETLYDRSMFALKDESIELKIQLEKSYANLKKYKNKHDDINLQKSSLKKSSAARSIWIGINSRFNLNDKIQYLKGQLDTNKELYQHSAKIKKRKKQDTTLVTVIKEMITALENYVKAEQIFLAEQSNQRKILKAREDKPMLSQPAAQPVKELPPLPLKQDAQVPLTKKLSETKKPLPPITLEVISKSIMFNLELLKKFDNTMYVGQPMEEILKKLEDTYNSLLKANSREEVHQLKSQLNSAKQKYADNYGNSGWNRNEDIESHLSNLERIMTQKSNLLPPSPSALTTSQLSPHTSTFLIKDQLNVNKVPQQKNQHRVKNAIKAAGLKLTNNIKRGVKNLSQYVDTRITKGVNLKVPKFKPPVIKPSLLSRSKYPPIKEDRSGITNFLFSSHKEITHRLSTNEPLQKSSMEVDNMAIAQATHDYSFCREDLNVGFSEFRGKRPSQEDRIVVDELKNCAALGNQDMVKLLESTISKANERCGNVADQGAALVTAIVHQEHIYTANIGDSSNYFVTVNQLGEVAVTRLNQNVHRATDEKEMDYIRKHGGKVFGGRLNGNLLISRAVGDDRHGEAINHAPDITEHRISIPKGGYAFMITCCDGLTEGNDKTKLQSERYVKTLVEECIINGTHPSDDPAKFSQLLAAKAIEEGSEDNISVIVTPLNEQNETTKMVAVFDGHGGDRVSQALRDNFLQIMNNEIAELQVTEGRRFTT